MQVELHYADITYEIIHPRPNPVLIENEVIGPSVTIDPMGYLLMFDLLFPTYPNPSDGSFINWVFLKGAHTLTNPDGGIEMLTLPLVQQQGNAWATYPSSAIVKARFRQSQYKLIVGQSSVQIFTTFTVIILLWCVVLLSLSCFNRVPEVSIFPELDLASKIPVPTGDKGLCGTAARLVKKKGREIVRELHGVMVQVVEQVERDGIELREH